MCRWIFLPLFLIISIISHVNAQDRAFSTLPDVEIIGRDVLSQIDQSCIEKDPEYIPGWPDQIYISSTGEWGHIFVDLNLDGILDIVQTTVCETRPTENNWIEVDSYLWVLLSQENGSYKFSNEELFGTNAVQIHGQSGGNTQGMKYADLNSDGFFDVIFVGNRDNVVGQQLASNLLENLYGETQNFIFETQQQVMMSNNDGTYQIYDLGNENRSSRNYAIKDTFDQYRLITGQGQDSQTFENNSFVWDADTLTWLEDTPPFQDNLNFGPYTVEEINSFRVVGDSFARPIDISSSTSWYFDGENPQWLISGTSPIISEGIEPWRDHLGVSISQLTPQGWQYISHFEPETFIYETIWPDGSKSAHQGLKIYDTSLYWGPFFWAFHMVQMSPFNEDLVLIAQIEATSLDEGIDYTEMPTAVFGAGDCQVSNEAPLQIFWSEVEENFNCQSEATSYLHVPVAFKISDNGEIELLSLDDNPFYTGDIRHIGKAIINEDMRFLDINGDDFVDVIHTNRFNKFPVVLLNDQEGKFRLTDISDLFLPNNGNEIIKYIDLNNDGLLDEVRWYWDLDVEGNNLEIRYGNQLLSEFSVTEGSNYLDTDRDGILDTLDNCPLRENLNNKDIDGDGLGNACDADDDNDGVLDENDPFPLDGSRSIRTEDVELKGVIDTKGNSSSTKFLASARTEDNELTKTDFTVSDNVLITGIVIPEIEDISEEGFVYVVIRTITSDSSEWSFRDLNGNFQAWSGRAKDLDAAYEKSALQVSEEFEIFNGSLVEGKHRIFIAYSTTNPDDPIHFNSIPLRLNVSE